MLPAANQGGVSKISCIFISNRISWNSWRISAKRNVRIGKGIIIKFYLTMAKTDFCCWLMLFSLLSLKDICDLKLFIFTIY